MYDGLSLAWLTSHRRQSVYRVTQLHVISKLPVTGKLAGNVYSVWSAETLHSPILQNVRLLCIDAVKQN